MKEIIIKKLQEMDLETAEKLSNAENMQEALEVLAACGIEATEETLVAALAELNMDENDELSEELLDGVAGGGKIWKWIKDCFGRWFKRQCEKNTREIDAILKSF